MPTAWNKRWLSVRWLMIVIFAFLVGEALYFSSIQDDPPPQINDIPEDVSIQFTVDKSAVLVLDTCVSGIWRVDGSDEIRVNDSSWTDQTAGSYTLCNQPDLSPTLEVRLPSSAIASYKLDVTVVYGNGLHVVAGLALLFLVMWIMGVQDASHRQLMILVVGIHIGFAILYSLTTDLNITNSWTWDSLVHTLPMADLRHNMLESLVFQHAQPPLYSIYGIVMGTVFGESHPQAMYVVQVIMGALMLVMSYRLLWHFTQHKTLTLFISILLALNPALFLFEALILYTIHAAFLILCATFCLLLYRQTEQNRYLYLFVLCINLLILLRSVYHIAFLIPTLILVALIVKENMRRVMIVCLSICLLSVGWYGKNLIVFDSFSSSSWFGMSLWKVARYDYSDNELQDLLKDDVLTDRTVIWFRPFMPPSAYPSFEPSQDDIRVLSGNNFNNAVYPEINRLYQDNALRLIAHDVGRYFNGVARAYGHYTCPSSTYELMSKNLDAFPASHQAVSVELFHMKGLTQEVARRIGLSQDAYGACSNLYGVLPLVMLGYPLMLLLQFRVNRRRWLDGIRQESVLLFIWGIVTFTTVATSFLEISENARFKFMVEMPLFILLVILVWRLAHLIVPHISEDEYSHQGEVVSP